MRGLFFRIKYEPMHLYAEKMKDSYNSIEYKKLDLSKNKNVKTASNYVEQEKRIDDLVRLYQQLVVKDVNDINKMIQEMEETDKKRSKKWSGIGVCITDFNPERMNIQFMYGPPTEPIGHIITSGSGSGANPGGGGGGRGR